MFSNKQDKYISYEKYIFRFVIKKIYKLGGVS